MNNPSGADTIIGTTTKSSSSSGTRNKRILIVDDEEDIAYCFKIALECAGFIVDIFNDPIKSLSSYKAGAYDLLLLDIKMPQMNGFELYDKIKEIKSMYVLLLHLRNIMMKSKSDFHTQRKQNGLLENQ